MADIKALVAEVERKEHEYNKARMALAAALGLSSFSAKVSTGRPGRPPGRPPGTQSIRAQVVDFVKTDPDGMTRAQILVKFPNPGGVHSALKVAKAAGELESVDGRWRVKRTPAERGPKPAVPAAQ